MRPAGLSYYVCQGKPEYEVASLILSEPTIDLEDQARDRSAAPCRWVSREVTEDNS
jgi:hypothetical protein